MEFKKGKFLFEHWYLIAFTMLSFAIATLLFYSCKKDQESVRILPSSLIRECQQFYEQQLEGSNTNRVSKSSTSKRQQFKKSPNWNKALILEISLGKAVYIPLLYEQRIYTKRGQTQQELTLEDLSYLMMYRDHDGNMHTELVTFLPSNTYWNNPNREQDPFNGCILIEDLDGSFIKGYRHFENGRIGLLSEPFISPDTTKPLLNNSIQKSEEQDCIYTDWYTCSSLDGGGTWSCRYSYTEITCNTTSGGASGEPGTTGGGTNSNDYPFNPLVPKPPFSMTTPCPGDPLIKMAITPINGQFTAGTYGYTRTNSDGTARFHDGIDLTCPLNTRVFSCWEGTVVEVDNDPKGYGNYLTVEYEVNGKPIRMRYAHLNTISVTVGSHVDQQSLLGLSGKTGNANSVWITPHVHIQTQYQTAIGNWVTGKNTQDPLCNPLKYLPSQFNTSTGVQTKSPC